MVTDASKIQGAVTQSCPGVGMLNVGQYRTVGVQDLIDANGGPRIPSAATAQKGYRAIQLVLSRDGLLTPEEMAYFELMARRAEERGLMPYSSGRVGGYSHPWFSATGGRGTLTSRLAVCSGTLPNISYGAW